MDKRHLRFLVLTFISLAMIFAACTRSASTPPPTEETGVQSDSQATMDAVRSAILTQTAQGDEGEASPTPTVESPAATGTSQTTATPIVLAATATPTAPEIEYTVQPGDWIFKIARDFGVDPQEIIDLNGLAAPGSIDPGMVLRIPAAASEPEPAPVTVTVTGTPSGEGTVHVVMPGEWIWQIARTYGVDPQTIIDANNLSSPATIYPGQELIIP